MVALLEISSLVMGMPAVRGDHAGLASSWHVSCAIPVSRGRSPSPSPSVQRGLAVRSERAMERSKRTGSASLNGSAIVRPEVRSGDVPQPILLAEGQDFNFTINRGVSTENTVSVNYDDFVNDVAVGDIILVDVKGAVGFRQAEWRQIRAGPDF